MLILFESVRDAVGYALDYQRTLDERALGIEARAGIHYGRIRLLAEALGERAHAEKNLNAVALSCLQGEVDLAEGRLERARASLQDAIGQAAAMGVDPHRIEQVADPREAIGRALAA